MKKYSLITLVLLLINNFSFAQNKYLCKIYQFDTTEKDTTLGLIKYFDANGKLYLEVYSGFRLNSWTSLTMQKIIYQYDVNSKLIKKTEFIERNDSNVTLYQYNAGKIAQEDKFSYIEYYKKYWSKIPDWNRQITKYNYNDSILIGKTTYDYRENSFKHILQKEEIQRHDTIQVNVLENFQNSDSDPLYIKTTSVYNHQGQLVIERKEYKKGKLFEQVEYFYDNNNRLFMVKTFDYTLKRDLISLYKYEYD